MVTYLEIVGKIDLVNQFLNQNIPRLVGGQTPWLFCDSTWLGETELLYQGNGQPFLDPATNQQANMRTFNPPNTLQLDTDTSTLLEQMQAGTAPDCWFLPSSESNRRN